MKLYDCEKRYNYISFKKRIIYRTNGIRDNQVHEADISKKFTAAQFCQDLPFHFCQSNIPVSCSQQQITDRHADPQEHSSHHHNKSELLELYVTEGENSWITVVNCDIIM